MSLSNIVLPLHSKHKVMEYTLKNGHTLKVLRDEFSDNNPREWDNLTKMICFHSRYELGDKHLFYKKQNYNSWDDMKADIIRRENPAVIKPLYLYDHSGIIIGTKYSEYPFNCPWDSCQIGYIFITKAAAYKEYNCKKITAKIRIKLENILESEVEGYNQYLSGDIWGFIELDAEGIEINSCWGFYSGDPTKNGMLEHLSAEIA